MDLSLGSYSPKRVESRLYDDLVFYFKYASSAYSLICPRPNGNHLVSEFSSPLSDHIRGYVARDSDRKEIVVAIKGSSSMSEIISDVNVIFVPFISPGVKMPSGVSVHSGFLFDWDSVALQVITLVEYQLQEHPGYSIVTTGHSLGGAISLLAAVTLRQKFPTSDVTTYSYGAPRTGNKAFAEFVNEQFGPKSHRVVHSNDGVPTLIPTSLGYHHHGIEYWQHTDPASADNTLKCAAHGEDVYCSASIPTQGINAAHMTYFGIVVSTPFCI